MSNQTCPKITILRDKTILHEFKCNKPNAEQSLKNLTDSLKTLQKDVNNFLTKLVEEAQESRQGSNNMTGTRGK